MYHYSRIARKNERFSFSEIKDLRMSSELSIFLTRHWESLGELDPGSDSHHLWLHDWWQVTEIQIPHLSRWGVGLKAGVTSLIP